MVNKNSNNKRELKTYNVAITILYYQIIWEYDQSITTN